MSLDKKFEDLFLNVSIKAALSSYHFVGKKDKIAADKSAVDGMWNKLYEIDGYGSIEDIKEKINSVIDKL